MKQNGKQFPGLSISRTAKGSVSSSRSLCFFLGMPEAERRPCCERAAPPAAIVYTATGKESIMGQCLGFQLAFLNVIKYQIIGSSPYSKEMPLLILLHLQPAGEVWTQIVLLILHLNRDPSAVLPLVPSHVHWGFYGFIFSPPFFL